MTDKQIIIDGYNLGYIKELLYNGKRSAISTNIFEAIIEELERKEQECENNKTVYQMELNIYNQECLNLQEELKAKEQECEELKEKLLERLGKECIE